MCSIIITRARLIFARLLLKFGFGQGIYYVNGPDTLPPPLTAEEENDAIVFVSYQNTCVACGREIPEGRLICANCELDTSMKRCIICDRPISDSDTICSTCKALIYRLENND